MKSEIKYPVGQQSFQQLREGGYLYVDKTSFIEKIISGGSYYFLGRPRRFGKSLFLSTLKAFFEGKRALFKDLYIDTIEWDWEPYPVFHLDLNNQKFKENNNLDILLEGFLNDIETKYDIKPLQKDHSERFARAIKAVAEKTGKGVVILVDEYDKPLVNNIHNHERFDFYRDKLSALYSNFKSSADYIHLVFLTGVSRFGKLSVFSGLNNLQDITFSDDFASICGITEDELTSNFRIGINELMNLNGHSFSEEIVKLKLHYDGYHFSAECPDIYNPFSLLNVFAQKKYQNYWISSGTPTLLVEQLKRTNTDLNRLLSARCSQTSLEGLDISNMRPDALFYQTGYLTIKSYDHEEGIYYLSLPNEEVKQGFFEYILPFYANLGDDDSKVFVFDFRKEIEEGNVDSFMERLQSLFAGISYEMRIEEERSVQNALLVLFTLIGMKVDVEYRTSSGRIDILIRTSRFVYIIELKFNRTAKEALQQIKKNEYNLPWNIDERQVIAIGVNFSSELRRIDSWESEIL